MSPSWYPDASGEVFESPFAPAPPPGESQIGADNAEWPSGTESQPGAALQPTLAESPITSEVEWSSTETGSPEAETPGFPPAWPAGEQEAEHEGEEPGGADRSFEEPEYGSFFEESEYGSSSEEPEYGGETFGEFPADGPRHFTDPEIGSEVENLAGPDEQYDAEDLLTPEREAFVGDLLHEIQGPGAYWRAQLRVASVGNTVEPLVDGPAAFRAMHRAIESATGRAHFIYLLGWWVDPWVNLGGPGTSLLDLFERAGKRGVQVRVLLWDAPLLLFRDHSNLHDAAEAAISKLPNCHAQQDSDGLTSPKSHHQKLLVVQGRDGLVALCGGVDVNADRIHELPPPRGSYRADRPAVGWTGSSGSGGSVPQGSGNPLHDVHARVTGPAARPLLRAFLYRWLARSGDRKIDQQAPLRGRYNQPVPAPTGRQFARVGETFDGALRLPSGTVRRRRVVDVQDIWLRSILGARQFIYIEEQYLQSDCAATAIRTVLPRLAHVTILLPPSEITDLPGVWQRRKRFIEAITKGNPHAGKLHIYTRAVPKTQPCVRANAPHLYVHSKMAVVDDELMLIGSANLNNRGWETDSELVVASFEDDRGMASVAGRLRMALWAHHLGVPSSTVADPVGSRQLWDTAGTRHVCPYDPNGGRDRSNRPNSFVDPSDRRLGDPCRTLLPTPPPAPKVFTAERSGTPPSPLPAGG